ncbi:restriction endonuclease [Bacillus cereus]|nr:restriction endonuclease [Bacillus cereus]
MNQIPYEIIEEMIQCFGRCFHYKDPVASFMRSSDVPIVLINKHRDNAKFVWARRVLEDLSHTEEGIIIQRRILTNLCNLRDLPDKEVRDRNAGIESLRKLKKLALKNDLIAKEQKNREKMQNIMYEKRQAFITERSRKLEELRNIFNMSISDNNRQRAGFTLEDLLKSLFELNDIEYRKSFRNTANTQQIDGYFKNEGFDYLVEAKWRKDMPNVAEIAGFKYKIESKLESTRGLFVSINGFREEVIKEFSGKGAKIIFMDGQDLMLILEGRISLKEALNIKIEKAAQIGDTFFPLYLIATR